MKTWNHTISLLRNNEQKIVANVYPDLRVYRVLGGSIEDLDVQMLLYPLDEQLNLLASAVQFCESQRVFYRIVLIDTPILLLVALNQSRSGRHLDSRSVKVSAEVKFGLNISQASPVGELSEAHHYELVAANELGGVSITLVAVDTLLVLVFVEEKDNLSEDCFSLVHGLRMAS